jgi:alkanesulfonate monooxygenase SsuD/methylene tetrahydromethanopterin reductase-like flavin-dependent oxidoreductase (luciferase family)
MPGKRGHPGRGQVFISAPTYLAETAQRAYSEPKDSIMHFYHEQANLLEGAARLVDTETAARRMRRVDQLRNFRYEDGLNNHALVGTPDVIAERLSELQQQVGLCGILAELNCGGLIPHRQVVAALELLCRDVKPQLAA